MTITARSSAPSEEASTALPLVVKGLVKDFGKEGLAQRLPLLGGRFHSEKRVRVVDGISFEVRRGEIYGVIGANGSGKSTLIRIVSTLLLPDEGACTVFGYDVVREATRVRSLINRVSADPSFFRNMSAMENLLFFGRVYGMSPESVKSNAPVILRRLGLEPDRALEPMSRLSRGQQQKVAVARSFLTSPVLMLLDEPD
jgi:ABC-2 type transport system ATP-binding protein